MGSILLFSFKFASLLPLSTISAVLLVFISGVADLLSSGVFSSIISLLLALVLLSLLIFSFAIKSNSTFLLSTDFLFSTKFFSS